MSAETIKDLGTNYVSGSSEMPRKYHLLNDRIDKMQEELKHKLKKNKDKKKLDKLLDTFLEASVIECDENFADGFALATILLAEAFTRKL